MTLLYRGRQYIALTPQQKTQKKDWLLQQQMQSAKGIPSWEQVVKESIEKSDGDKYAQEVEEVEYLYNAEFNARIVELAAKETGNEDIEYGYDGSDPDEYLEEFGVAPDAVNDLREQAADDVILAQYEEKFGDVVDTVRYMDGEECYRLIALKDGVDPTTLNGLGVYWSLEPNRTGLYDLDDDFHKTHPNVFRFTGIVDLDYVNEWETIMAQMSPDYGNEVEVQFFKHAPIKIIDIERIEGYNRGHGPALEDSYTDVTEVIEVNDTRRC